MCVGRCVPEMSPASPPAFSSSCFRSSTASESRSADCCTLPWATVDLGFPAPSLAAYTICRERGREREREGERERERERENAPLTGCGVTSDLEGRLSKSLALFKETGLHLGAGGSGGCSDGRTGQ